MTILLNNTFELANGDDRTARVCGGRGLALTQQTPQALRLRAEWPTLFHARASRQIVIDLEITLPSCATLEAAEEQAHAFSVSIPKGGDSLSFTVGETTVEYPQWALVSAAPESLGVTNIVRVQIKATNPQVTEEAREQFESGQHITFEDEP